MPALATGPRFHSIWLEHNHEFRVKIVDEATWNWIQGGKEARMDKATAEHYMFWSCCEYDPSKEPADDLATFRAIAAVGVEIPYSLSLGVMDLCVNTSSAALEDLNCWKQLLGEESVLAGMFKKI